MVPQISRSIYFQVTIREQEERLRYLMSKECTFIIILFCLFSFFLSFFLSFFFFPFCSCCLPKDTYPFWLILHAEVSTSRWFFLSFFISIFPSFFHFFFTNLSFSSLSLSLCQRKIVKDHIFVKYIFKILYIHFHLIFNVNNNPL